MEKTLSFDELKEYLDEIPQPNSRVGIFDLTINNRGRKYSFERLKTNFSLNEDLLGFGLNHYGWLHLIMPSIKKSKFHDDEDVCVDIWRREFISAILTEKEINIKTKNFTVQVNWE